MTHRVHPVEQLRPRGPLRVPGDKSMSHRALIFGALAEGSTEVGGLLDSADVRSTRACLEALGVTFEDAASGLRVHGRGLRGLRRPVHHLDCGNSGTTIRLLAGVLAGQTFTTTLRGDASLCRRPMQRVADPLRRMGARIDLQPGGLAPMTLHGGVALQAIDYALPVASAQVKSALLLAALYAEGRTELGGRTDSRDHSERMLRYFGVSLGLDAGRLAVEGGQKLTAAPLLVPGDPSSAAFLWAAAARMPGGPIEVRDVLLNPTRIGFLRVLERMGAAVEIEVTRRSPEEIGSVRLGPGALRATEVGAEEIPSLVDELPMLAVLATAAEGTTVIRGAEELRHKESDRIEAVAVNLRALGVEVETFADGMAVPGPQRLRAGVVQSGGDHRVAMAFAIGALWADGPVDIVDPGCVEVSWPGFFEALEMLT